MNRWRKLLLVAASVAALFALLVLGLRALYPFLAITTPASGQMMVVEGWIPTYTLPLVAEQAKHANYAEILVVRPIYNGQNKHESGQYAADYIANSLVQLGVPRTRLHTVFLDASHKDRTYSSALAARNWIQERGLLVESLDVVTLGSHARRSRLLFQIAFGKQARVGVIATADRHFDPSQWWRSSEGIREVPFEALAYLYAKFFFHPPAPETTERQIHSTPRLPGGDQRSTL